MDANSARSGTEINSPATELVLTREILSEMHANAASAFPEECCGLILGTFEDETQTKRAVESLRMNNVFVKEERYHRYTIDPKDFLVAETDAEARGLEVVGIYHSHPNAPARPSQFDTNHAWPTLSYVVIEVRESQPVDTKSWILKDDRSEFTTEEIKLGKKEGS
jgi:proteasome lid subunit RPN8/RPN11